MTRVLLRLGLSLFPLALTPLLGFLIVEGHLNFGSGCKDILVVFPWMAWSLFYALIALACWRRRLSFLRTLAWAVGGATGLLLLTALLLLGWYMAGSSPPDLLAFDAPGGIY